MNNGTIVCLTTVTKTDSDYSNVVAMVQRTLTTTKIIALAWQAPTPDVNPFTFKKKLINISKQKVAKTYKEAKECLGFKK